MGTGTSMEGHGDLVWDLNYQKLRSTLSLCRPDTEKPKAEQVQVFTHSENSHEPRCSTEQQARPHPGGAATSREPPHTGQPEYQEVRVPQRDSQAGIYCMRRRRQPGRRERERHWGQIEQQGKGLDQGHGK